jgi:ABC-type branched-subunit amino acid transport system ATPase component/ABC-type branched-subunit amino acid transport system permease subunit
VLVAPSQYGQFDFAALGPEQLFLALGAAAFGAFVSIPMALVGGLALGVAYQLTLGVTANAGTAQVVLFVLVLVVIVVRGRVIGSVFAVEGAPGEDRRPLRVPLRVRERFVVRRQRWLLAGSGLFVAAVLPLLPGLRTEGHRFQLTLVVLYAIVGISITMLVGWGGQLSLGNFAVVGVGAFVTARLAHHGWSVPALLAVTGCLGAGVMLVVGLPALRVRGLTLAVTTLGFGVVASDWLFHAGWFTSAPGTILDLRPLLFLRGLGSPSKQLPIYAMSLGLLIVVALAARGLRNSTPGRLIVAVRDDEQAAAAHGVTPATVKLSALAVSGFFAGTVGVLWADAWRVASPEHFAPALSLSLLAVPVIGGLGSVAGAIAGAAALYLPTYFLLDGQPGFQLAFGGLMMVFALLIFPTGLAGAVQRAWEWFLQRLDAELPQPVPARVDAPVLAVEGVQVSFGGVQALDGVSIHLREGEILGLIGSNGAGKSTLINAISGVVRPSRGSVILMGTDVSQLAPELRAGLGLARSFQAAHLFPGLTVRETVQAMLGSSVGIGVLASMVRAPWARRAEQTCAAEADLLIDRMGLTPWADTLTAELSTGTRRVCDLAIQLAAKPKVLLLDEPTAGVAQRDAEAFGPLLQRIRDELNCAIIIVEHDMPLLMGLCDRVYAMGEGSIIAEGTPDEIRHNADVVAAYLGTDEVAISRSGRLPSSRKNFRHPNGANGASRTNGKAGANRRARTPAQAETVTDTERRAP